MTDDLRSAPGIPSGTGGLPQPCRCCHDLGWIDEWSTNVCADDTAHDRQPRHDFDGVIAHECPHCSDPDPTLELPAPTPQRRRSVLEFARQITAPIYNPDGVHRGVLRELRAAIAIEHSKEQTDA